jgi:adenylate cyclase
LIQYFDFLRSFINKDFRSFSSEDLKTFNLTITFCFVALIVFPFFMLAHYLMGDYDGAVFLLCFSLLFGCSLLVLKATKSTPLVGNLGTFLFFCITTYFSYTQGGFDSTSIISKIASPIIAYILVGKSAAFFWLLLEIISISIFYILTSQGFYFPNAIPAEWIDFDRFLLLMGSLFTLFVLFMYSETSRLQILKELQKERERSEFLLYNTLPKHIALRLKDEKKQIADYFPNCTVLFADLVGFTALSTTKSPSEIVQLLDRIFSEFDAITAKYNIEKIKTIGDCYMAAVGIQDVNTHQPTNHSTMVEFAFSMIDIISEIKQEVGFNLQIRIGLSSGEVVAGVIGFEKLAYDLWGDTVNTASRMESHGIPGLIHCTESTYQLLKNEYSFVSNDVVLIKGKGKMRTYFISRKES